ncbi:hypothetical protein CAPN002_00640 [Capnocytophaga stomatis]|nr:hypothetical protein CAPN002_00640 [Capnocytophaga stomatis]
MKMGLKQISAQILSSNLKTSYHLNKISHQPKSIAQQVWEMITLSLENYLATKEEMNEQT